MRYHYCDCTTHQFDATTCTSPRMIDPHQNVELRTLFWKPLPISVKASDRSDYIIQELSVRLLAGYAPTTLKVRCCCVCRSHMSPLFFFS